ncbi:SUKH-3 domain-containing protein [Embleya sp. AB8]|uniref:SUKH-3 domain-containing protein n=1 Tax=Embleya sp. AB8 TaxID=3156304 RepID=UPI003C74A119
MTQLNSDARLRLAAAGWQLGSRDDERARRLRLAVATHRSPGGLAHTAHPAAVEAWARYASLRVEQDGAGAELALRTFAFDPMEAIHTVQGCAAFGAHVGHRMAPLGILGAGEAFLLIDNTGRVFSRDHTGDWFVGIDIDAAINTLTSGTAFVRVREDGTW